MGGDHVLEKMRKQYVKLGLIIAVASIMARLGHGDLLNHSGLQELGYGILSYLPFILGLLVALGMDEYSKGFTSLLYVICYMPIHSMMISYGFEVSLLQGILAGALIGLLPLLRKYASSYYKTVYLYPLFLFLGICIGVFMVALYSGCSKGIEAYCNWLVQVPKSLGSFLYGSSHILLKPFGLSSVLDRSILLTEHPESYLLYLNGKSSGSIFMTGFYPILIFGYLGILGAYFVQPTKEKKRKDDLWSVGILIIVSIVTGVVEGVEYLILFIAPILYISHSVLTGVSFLLCYVASVKMGFLFSGGLIDYFKNYGMGLNSPMIICIGSLIFLLYFILFCGVLYPRLTVKLFSDVKKRIITFIKRPLHMMKTKVQSIKIKRKTMK